jgi:glycosyltransferase involved in cell wall biosynthesis
MPETTKPEKLLVFIPCYNCAAQIGRVLSQLKGPLARRFAEVLVLDNGSKDGTLDAAVTAAPEAEVPRVTVARNRANYNLGGSHKAAFAYAEREGFTHVVVLHGDDQGSIADLAPVLDAGQHLRHDACLGARFAKGSALRGYSRFRIFGNRVFNLLFTLGARRRVLDLGSGLNVFAASVFTDRNVLRYADDLRFNNFLLLGLFDARRSVMFFPISWREDDQVSNVKMTSQALKTLAILRDYCMRPGHFRQADHRTVPHERYEFDVVHPAAHDPAQAPAAMAR